MMIDKLIQLLSTIQLIRKIRKRNKKFNGSTVNVPKDYKAAYYDLLNHIYINNIYLVDRYVRVSPSRQFEAKNSKELLVISSFENNKWVMDNDE